MSDYLQRPLEAKEVADLIGEGLFELRLSHMKSGKPITIVNAEAQVHLGDLLKIQKVINLIVSTNVGRDLVERAVNSIWESDDEEINIPGSTANISR